MWIMDWTPALSTTSLLAMALYLFRKFITTRLTNAVGHEYDEKIENLKTTLRQGEESFKAELRAKESQIDALRSGALTGLVNRQVAFYERQIAAIEQLWNAVISLAPAKAISTCMASINFDVAAKGAAQNSQFRETFNMLGSGFDIKKYQNKGASQTRPFISPLSWALYSAYEAIVLHAVLKLEMLKSGLDILDMVDVLNNPEQVIKLVHVALPHRVEYVKKLGTRAFHYLLEELERRLLAELDNILRGVQSDKESIERAALILKESERLREIDASLSISE